MFTVLGCCWRFWAFGAQKKRTPTTPPDTIYSSYNQRHEVHVESFFFFFLPFFWICDAMAGNNSFINLCGNFWALSFMEAKFLRYMSKRRYVCVSRGKEKSECHVGLDRCVVKSVFPIRRWLTNEVLRFAATGNFWRVCDILIMERSNLKCSKNQGDRGSFEERKNSEGLQNIAKGCLSKLGLFDKLIESEVL